MREDPWLMILLCRYGHLFPWGGDLLAASVDGHPNVAGRLRRLKCCQVVQDGEFGELTATFHVKDFDRMAEVMRARRRPRPALAPERRQELADRIRNINRQRQRESDPTAPDCDEWGLGVCDWTFGAQSGPKNDPKATLGGRRPQNTSWRRLGLEGASGLGFGALWAILGHGAQDTRRAVWPRLCPESPSGGGPGAETGV